MTTPPCPSWCDLRDEASHWMPIRNGLEAIHEHHFGKLVTVCVWNGFEDDVEDWAAPVVSIRHHGVEIEGESLLEADEFTDFNRQITAAHRLVRSLARRASQASN